MPGLAGRSRHHGQPRPCRRGARRVARATGRRPRHGVLSGTRGRPARATRPFALQLAWQGTPVAGNGRLVVVSHGSGGSPWVHTHLARALVQAGFVVALPEHAGDNYKDHSTPGPESWKRRPAEVSRAVDAVAQDALLAPLLALDKVGVFGGSAGGHTALVFAGGNGLPPASSSTARPIWRRIFRPASASPPACTATGWTASRRPWPSPSSATALATRRCMHTPTRAWRPRWPWCRLRPTSTWTA